MTPDPITAAVTQIIAEVIHDYGLDSAIVMQGSTFGGDLGMDGEDVSAIIMRCEDRFGIKIHDDFDGVIAEQSRVGELIELVSDLLSEKAAREARAAGVKKA